MTGSQVRLEVQDLAVEVGGTPQKSDNNFPTEKTPNSPIWSFNNHADRCCPLSRVGLVING